LRGQYSLSDIFRITAKGPSAIAGKSHEFGLELEFRFNTKNGVPIIGGILYSGYPYLPSYTTRQGFTSANFGLPREMRLVWNLPPEPQFSPPGASGLRHAIPTEPSWFLDDEMSIVQKEPISHSGLHVLSTGPIQTDRIRLRMQDFPRILRSVTQGSAGLALEEFWGLCIDSLCFFSYLEDVRYRPELAMGVLATLQTPALSGPHYFAPTALGSPVQDLVSASPEYLHSEKKKYYAYSPASALQGPRTYTDVTLFNKPTDEFFLTPAMKKASKVVIYLEQADENQRAVGGFRITGCYDSVLDRVTSGQSGLFDLHIYEIDPPAGVSPIAPERDPRSDKYATLVGSMKNQLFESNLQEVRLTRASSARYFALVFSCVEEGYLGINRISPVQSAHVVLTSRKSRSQQLARINFRIIGEHLAEDYSRIGRDGFKFAFEHIVGGEVKQTLFEARSLVDLLQLSGVRIYSNQRFLETRREVTEERSETHPGSFEDRLTETRQTGWRRSESGRGVRWAGAQGSNRSSDPGGRPFSTFSNAEVRSRTEHVGFQAGDMADTATAIQQLTNIDVVSAAPADRLRSGLGFGTGNRNGAWFGFSANDLRGIDGMINLTSPPMSFPILYFQVLRDMLLDPVNAATTAADPIFRAQMATLVVLNGATLGANLGGALGPISAGTSISLPQLLPTMTRTAATGTSGNIIFQANRSRYSYSQHINEGYDESDSYTSFRKSEMNRTVKRDLLQPGTERERTAGVNVHWQEKPYDIITGTLPLSLNLPATADKMHEDRDESLRVRFGNGMSDGLAGLAAGGKDKPEHRRDGSIIMDIWFDVKEEEVRDDY
jgi:hypothetical protein